MKLWLASYPRSGNTFIRNILYDCYAISSAAFDTQILSRKNINYESFEVVKTHELFEAIPEHLKDLPKVYIVRDGRDAMVSQAYQMLDYGKSALAPYLLMTDIILSKENSHFGGWSANVVSWSKVSDIILKFEELIVNPMVEVSKINAVYSLPVPNLEKIPTFESQKQNATKYGNVDNQFQHFFRKGIPGSWRDETPIIMQDLFWAYHGHIMERWNYTYDDIYKNQVDDTFKVKNEIIRYMIYGKSIDKKLYKILLSITKGNPVYFTLSLYYILRELIYNLIK